MAEANQVEVENKVKDEEITFHENVWYKSITLIVNIVINLFIFLTLYICLMYVPSTDITISDLHIVLCVLGYQLFMWQGIMMMSKYNSWSLFIQPHIKRQIHAGIQIISVVLVTAGTGIALKITKKHFDTMHGILGVAAFAFCLVSLLNGFLSMLAHQRSFSIGWLNTCRCFHYLTGISTLFLATGSLCYGFQTRSFIDWTGRGEGAVLALVIVNWIITALVALDLWIVMITKLVKIIKKDDKIITEER